MLLNVKKSFQEERVGKGGAFSGVGRVGGKCQLWSNKLPKNAKEYPWLERMVGQLAGEKVSNVYGKTSKKMIRTLGVFDKTSDKKKGHSLSKK